VGPAYSSRLIEFARTRWDPEAAATNSDSLHRCIQKLRQMIIVNQPQLKDC
jgi:hypothetical protein